MAAQPQIERRKYPRVPADALPLLLGEDSKKPLRIRDLSRSGVCFYAEDPIPLMTRVRFAVEFPRRGNESAVASGEGVVVRCERVAAAVAHYEVAVFFSHLDADAAVLVESYVQAQLSPSRQP